MKKHAWFGIGKIVSFIRPYSKILVWMAILGIFSSLFDSLYPLFNRYALDHFIQEGTLNGLPLFIVAYVGIAIVQELDNYYCLYQCGKIEMCIDRDLRDASFNHLQTLSFAYFNQNSVGYIHARVMSDTAKIGDLVSWRMMDLVWNVSYLVSIFVLMFMMNVHLTLYVLALVPVAVLCILAFQNKLFTLNHRVRELNSTITSDFNEGITGAGSIKTLHAEKQMVEDFLSDSSKMYRTSVWTTHHSALLTSLVTMVSSVALAMILWQGGLLSQEGFLQIGTLSVFMSYAVGMLSPIQSIIETLSSLISIQANIERLTQLLEEKSDVADSPEVIERYGDNFHPKKENWEPLHGDIAFQDVTFMYPDGKENILEHFNLDVKQGTNVAIVGETGAGKSTVVNLVCRFFEPTKGQVLIDGKDARARSQLWLHSHIGYVLQTPHLFSGTIRENILYGNANASDEDIWEALRVVSADDIVSRLEHGLDQEVGEGGSFLSTGEKQLLSFARALVANPAIFILDEATSSIDSLTEHKLQVATQKLIQGRTSFVIAHRLSTIVDADVILAVKDGKIVEQGNHASLLEKRGYYYRLYRQQFERILV